jgi:hypothetical protein
MTDRFCAQARLGLPRRSLDTSQKRLQNTNSDMSQV